MDDTQKEAIISASISSLGPDIYHVRIIRRAKQLSWPVVLLLPGDPAPDLSAHDPKSVFINLTPPNMVPYHASLGRFLNNWGKLEISMHELFASTFGAEREKCGAISRPFSGKALRDLIESLSSQAHGEVVHKELVNLLERYSKANTKRNRIVHGYWVIEVVIKDRPPGKGSQLVIDTFRQTAGMPTHLQRQMEDLTERKLRSAHLFNIRAIDAVGEDALLLCDDIGRFTKKYHAGAKDASP